jgi:chromosome segregation ATPase
MATSKELTEEVRAAEAATTEAEADVSQAEVVVAELEEKATRAKPATIGELAGALAAARAKLDVLRLKLAAALDFRQRAKDRAEAKAREEAIEALRERKAALEARFMAWGAEKESMDARAREMRTEFYQLLNERQAIESADARLKAELGAVQMGPVCGQLWAHARVAGSAFAAREFGL